MSEVFNNNEFTSEPSQQSSNSYPYSFEQPFDAQQQPFAAQPQPSAPVPEQKKKSGKAGKIVALLLACALVRGSPAAEHDAGLLRCVRHARGQAAGSGSAGRIR